MMFSRKHLETLSAIVIDAAEREVMPRFRNLSPHDIRQKKSPTDLVTEADEAAERAICAALATAFPGALLIGEEGMAANPALLEKLPDADLAFVIDPVDVTLNYASGLPIFAVMAAALVRGEVVASIIHDPNARDSAMALRGEGAWMAHLDGRTRDLRVAKPASANAMSGMVSWRYFNEPLRTQIPASFSQFEDVSSLRCCGQEYRMAADGHCHFLLYGHLNPWDHAPGTLLCNEAGGHARLLNGQHYRAGAKSEGLLCAPDHESWNEIKAAFFGITGG